MDAINEHFDEVIERIRDPGKAAREQREFEESPVMAAGLRGLDRLRWDFAGADYRAKQLAAQGL